MLTVFDCAAIYTDFPGSTSRLTYGCDAEFTGLGSGWAHVMDAFSRQGLVSPRHVHDAEVLWCLGHIIHNTDMHLGNASLQGLCCLGMFRFYVAPDIGSIHQIKTFSRLNSLADETSKITNRLRNALQRQTNQD